MILTYIDQRTIDGDKAFVWTPDRYSWLAAFRDQNGNIKDLFFDSFLLLGYRWRDGKVSAFLPFHFLQILKIRDFMKMMDYQ
jgi:hypothetical protein